MDRSTSWSSGPDRPARPPHSRRASWSDRRRRGADLVGGSCPYIGCMPSKSLLHSAAVHRAGGDIPWQRASARRDYMVNRAADAEEPDDTGTSRRWSGPARAYPRQRAIVARGRVEVGGTTAPKRTARGPERDRRRPARRSRVPPSRASTRRPAVDQSPGDADARAAGQPARPRRRPDRGASSPRSSPASASRPRSSSPDRGCSRDHPRNSAAYARRAWTRRRDDPNRRAGHRARAGAGPAGPTSSSSTTGRAEGHDDPARDRARLPARGAGARALRDRRASGGTPIPHDGRLRIADGLWLVGDPAGPELHTHVSITRASSRSGWRSARRRARLPRDPARDLHRSRGRVGRVDARQAREAGIDAFEEVADIATSAKGYAVEAEAATSRSSWTGARGARRGGDGGARRVGGDPRMRPGDPGAGAGDVLAETIHAFPSTSRIFGGLFADAARARRPGSVVIDAASASKTTSAVDQDEVGPRRRQRAARLDGLVERRAGMTIRSARWPTSRPRSVSPAEQRRIDAGGAERAFEVNASSGPKTPVSDRPAGARGGPRGRCPATDRRLDRRVGAERDDGARAASSSLQA